MLSIAAVGAMAMSLLAGPAMTGGPVHQVPARVPPDSIHMEVVTVNGSGCPLGTAAVAPAPDRTAFTVTYSDFTAKIGPGAAPTDMRKNCQIAVKVTYPAGFTFAIAQADYRGFAHLALGAWATERANYYFQGSSVSAWRTHRFNGPADQDWLATDRTATAALVWQPCGTARNVNINTELLVYRGTSPRTASSFMMMDSTDGSIKNLYHLEWETC